MARALVGNLGETVSKTTASFVDLPKIAAPYTTVVNRAQVTDFAADGLPKFGFDRIMTQSIVEAQDEQGPNGERVFKSVNDIHDQVRWVGHWTINNDAYGQYASNSSNTTSYVEVTFYGTGLNVVGPINSDKIFAVSVNGGSETNITTPITTSNVLGARNYSMNNVLNLVSGLTAGVHTVKIRNGNSITISGFEVVNSSSSIYVPKAETFSGSRRRHLSTATTSAYNSGFESGTLGTRGGHVVVYQKADGTVAKAVTPTNASAAYLSSADHTNEEEVRVFHWREFGAGRTDDFSSLTPASSSDRTFTLDDGTTTLIGRSVVTATSETCAIAVDNTGFLTFTFVGTGLDVTWVTGASGTNGSANAFEVFINGTSVGNWDTTAVAGIYVKKKICSGLPYGTHTVKIQRNAANVWSLTVKDFTVYAPKTPTLPDGAVALADYFIMADFVANTTAGISTVATGVLRKGAAREMIYMTPSGSYSVGLDPALYINGLQVTVAVSGASTLYTFYGTGFELRGRANTVFTTNATLSIDGSANWSAFSSSAYGGFSIINSTTGQISQGVSNTLGSGLRVSGLTLGLHTVTLTNNAAASYVIEAIDVITPIHAPKEIGSIKLQNVSLIGSCSIRDLRNFSEQQVAPQKAVVQAVGVNSGPTISSGSDIPMPDMSLTIKTSGSPVFITFDTILTNNSVGQTSDVILYINGASYPSTRRQAMPSTAGYRSNVSFSWVAHLAAGVHKIDAYWAVSGGTGTAVGANRVLSAQEI